MELPIIVAAGIFDSKIVAKNTVVSRKRTTTMFEIELPIDDGGISYIDDSFSPIKTNMVVCAKSDQKRYTRFPYKCYYIHMIVHDGILYDTLIKIPDFFETDKYETYERIFKRLIKHYNALSKGEEIIIQSLILELLYDLGKDSAQNIAKQKNTNRHLLTEKAIGYIKEHLTEDLSLDTLAGAMSLSPIYFHNLFKVSTGKTLREFVEEYRIKKAIDLLLTTDFSLTKIAYECGFSSQSYFSYAFKRKMKLTPRKYIQELYSRYEL